MTLLKKQLGGGNCSSGMCSSKSARAAEQLAERETKQRQERQTKQRQERQTKQRQERQRGEGMSRLPLQLREFITNRNSIADLKKMRLLSRDLKDLAEHDLRRRYNKIHRRDIRYAPALSDVPIGEVIRFLTSFEVNILNPAKAAGPKGSEEQRKVLSDKLYKATDYATARYLFEQGIRNNGFYSSLLEMDLNRKKGIKEIPVIRGIPHFVMPVVLISGTYYFSPHASEIYGYDVSLARAKTGKINKYNYEEDNGKITQYYEYENNLYHIDSVNYTARPSHDGTVFSWIRPYIGTHAGVLLSSGKGVKPYFLNKQYDDKSVNDVLNRYVRPPVHARQLA